MKTKFKQTEIGIIPEDWEIAEIGDVFELSQGLQISTKLRVPSHKEGYLPLLKITELPQKKFSEFVSLNDVKENYVASKNDIIFTRTGQVGLVYTDMVGCVHNNCFKIHYGDFDKSFVYHMLKQKRIFEYANAVASGTVQKDLTHPAFKSCLIVFPKNKEEQIKIGQVFDNLEHTIENLQKQNQILEQIIQSIFKHGFVDFEFPNEQGKPYMSSGGEMIDSELGKIPSGWYIKKIGSEFKLVLGGTPSTTNKSYWKNGSIAWINSGKINEFRIIEPTAYITDEAVNNSATKLLPKRTTVLAITGATLGQVSRIEIDTCANQSVIGIIESETITSEYIYYCIKHTIREIISHQTGGAQQHINKNNVDNSKILIPSIKVLQEYQKIIKPIFDKISSACFEINELTQIRDSLLPKLMSGKIRVPVETN